MGLFEDAVTLTARPVRALFAITVCVVLSACASNGTRPDAAVESRAAVAREQPSDSDQRNRQFQHAEALYLSGHLKEAAAAFAELTRAYPRDPHVWLKYGNTLTRQASFDEAATAFQTAANLDPSLGAATLNLALVRLAQAQVALDAAVGRLSPDTSEHAQAEGLQRQIKTLLGPAAHTVPSH